MAFDSASAISLKTRIACVQLAVTEDQFAQLDPPFTSWASLDFEKAVNLAWISVRVMVV
jgi:hypothetical protein